MQNKLADVWVDIALLLQSMPIADASLLLSVNGTPFADEFIH